MSRFFLLSLVALVCAASGCVKPETVEVAPPEVTTRAEAEDPRPGRLPVAPMPHLPGEPPEQDLTNEDLGIGPGIEAPLPQIERLDQKTVDEKVIQDNIGQPPVPGLEEPAPVTPPFTGRTGATKSRLIRENGGNAESELAVARGLAWLAKQQSKDGSWAFDAGSMKDEPAAATGLALLPFLGAGETHKQGMKYKDAVKVGIQWLVKNINAKGADAGKFEGARTLNGQALATLALVEAYALTLDPMLKAPAQLAVDYLQKKQDANGSWADPGADRNTSLVGWPVQALKAAKLTKDLNVDDKVFANAAKFLDATAAGPRKSMYGHKDGTDAKPGTGITAVGLLCRYSISDWGPVHPGLIDGVEGLMKNPPPATEALKDLYYYHHATQVVYYHQSEEWKAWNEGKKQADGSRKGGMRDWLTTQQNKKDANTGSWDPEQGWIGSSGGRLATTATCLLTLEVYYRNLRLYKFDNGKAIKIIE